MVNRGRHMMLIGARAAKERHGRRRHVFRRHCRKLALNLHFALMARQFDRAVAARRFGHIDKQIIYLTGPDCRQHGLAVGIGEGEVTHQSSSFT